MRFDDLFCNIHNIPIDNNGIFGYTSTYYYAEDDQYEYHEGQQ